MKFLHLKLAPIVITGLLFSLIAIVRSLQFYLLSKNQGFAGPHDPSLILGMSFMAQATIGIPILFLIYKFFDFSKSNFLRWALIAPATGVYVLLSMGIIHSLEIDQKLSQNKLATMCTGSIITKDMVQECIHLVQPQKESNTASVSLPKKYQEAILNNLKAKAILGKNEKNNEVNSEIKKQIQEVTGAAIQEKIKLATEAVREKKYSEAITLANEALKHDLKNPDAISIVRVSMKNLEQKKADGKTPELSKSEKHKLIEEHYAKGLELFQKSKYEASIQELNEALKLDLKHERTIALIRSASEQMSKGK